PGLLSPVPAVGVHEQLGRIADHVARQGDPGEVALDGTAPRLADLYLDPRDTLLLHPAAELVGQLPVVVAGEPAAAVDRDALVHRSQQPPQPYPQQPRLEIP